MAFSFDLQAAINQIAILEDAIASPLPGVVTAYTYSQNPIEITNPALLPAVVHVPLGPRTPNEAGGHIPGHLGAGIYSLVYEIYSRLLIIEVVTGKYPADEAVANAFWEPVCETFFNRTNAVLLCNAAGADSYACVFPERSYGIRAWPPVDEPGQQIHRYWSLQYVHRFGFHGG